MTTIAYKNHTLASDSQNTGSDGSISKRGDKIFSNGNIAFGVAGRSLVISILKFMKIPPMPTEADDWSLEKWIGSVFILELRKELKSYGFENDNGRLGSCTFLMYVHNRCFRFDSDFNYTEITDSFDAIGSGRKYALASMYLGASPAEAVKVAKKFDDGTGGNVISVRLSGKKGKKK